MPTNRAPGSAYMHPMTCAASITVLSYKAEDGANVNQAESYFSRLRRAEIGQHHRISGHLLYQYANEAAWREDNRRKPNGSNWNTVIGAALTSPKSPVWTGYWHRSAA